MWKYKIGTVVQEKDGSHIGAYSGLDARAMFGHVVGFKNNGHETILEIKWDDGSTRLTHPFNVLAEEDVR